MKPPVLLCYNLCEEKAQQIRLISMRLMIRVQKVQPLEYGEHLSALCGLEAPSFVSAPQTPFLDEMLVLAFFTDELINRFLLALRQAKLPPVILKAILTDTNMLWNSVTLHEHLIAEHEALASAQPSVHTPADRA